VPEWEEVRGRFRAPKDRRRQWLEQGRSAAAPGGGDRRLGRQWRDHISFVFFLFLFPGLFLLILLAYLVFFGFFGFWAVSFFKLKTY
jgi:hypothetical protein